MTTEDFDFMNASSTDTFGAFLYIQYSTLDQLSLMMLITVDIVYGYLLLTV